VAWENRFFFITQGSACIPLEACHRGVVTGDIVLLASYRHVDALYCLGRSGVANIWHVRSRTTIDSRLIQYGSLHSMPGGIRLVDCSLEPCLRDRDAEDLPKSLVVTLRREGFGHRATTTTKGDAP